MGLYADGIPGLPGQREYLVTDRKTTRYVGVVAGRQRSVLVHAMENLTQVRHGMWSMSQFPYGDGTTYIPTLNLTSGTH